MNTIDWDLLSSYAGLLSLATLSIYAGSYGSLPVFRFIHLGDVSDNFFCGRSRLESVLVKEGPISLR